MKWYNRSPLLSDELSRQTNLEPHVLLGVAADATVDEIKNAYRRMVKVYHPDKADQFMRNHNEQVVKLINAAFEKLTKRKNDSNN